MTALPAAHCNSTNYHSLRRLLCVCRPVSLADNQAGVLERDPGRTALVHQGEDSRRLKPHIFNPRSLLWVRCRCDETIPESSHGPMHHKLVEMSVIDPHASSLWRGYRDRQMPSSCRQKE